MTMAKGILLIEIFVYNLREYMNDAAFVVCLQVTVKQDIGIFL